MTSRRRGGWHRITRDLVLFSVGIGLAVYQVIVYQGPERPFTLAFIGTMLGLPFAMRFDEARREVKRADDESEVDPR